MCIHERNGRVPEWLKGTGCKPVGYAYLGSNPSAPTILSDACVAQSVEHFVGNEEVTGSSPVAGSIFQPAHLHGTPYTPVLLAEDAHEGPRVHRGMHAPGCKGELSEHGMRRARAEARAVGGSRGLEGAV